MYCPNRVGTRILLLKVSSGKNRKGVKVMPIWIKAIVITVLRYILDIKKIPTRVSQMAKKIMEIEEGIRSLVIRAIVWIAKSSAGLKAEKNFKEPNHT